MNKLYFVCSDYNIVIDGREYDLGGYEGFIDENGDLLGWWSEDDADWRFEYFNPFLEKLGYVTVPTYDGHEDKCRKFAEYLIDLLKISPVVDMS